MTESDTITEETAGSSTDDRPAVVLPLNDAAAVYEALAEQIRGSAVGWSDHSLAQLEEGLLQRYGPSIGGRHAVRRLVRLAARPPAA